VLQGQRSSGCIRYNTRDAFACVVQGTQPQEKDVVMDEPKVPAGTEQVRYACGAAAGGKHSLVLRA
jgi:hypothetical protein